jgi:hypothetical protein
MKVRFFLSIAALAIALVACGANSDSQATSSPSAAPTIAPTPDAAQALSVKLVTANIVGTPEPDGTEPVRIVYRVTITAPHGISSAYGDADLPPGEDSCDGGSIGIALGALPNGATLEQTHVVLCPASQAKEFEDEPPSFFTLTWNPSTVTYP